jgi:hypothetical protein
MAEPPGGFVPWKSRAVGLRLENGSFFHGTAGTQLVKNHVHAGSRRHSPLLRTTVSDAH